MRFLRQNTDTRVTVGPFLDKTDGITPEVALTVTNEKLTLMVDTGGVPTLVLDAAPTASGGANDMVHVTGDDAGFYDLELAAANVNYVGRAILALTDAANHCPVFHEFMILPAQVYDSMIGTDNLQVDTIQVGGTSQTARDLGASVLLSPGTGTGQITVSSGAVTAGTVSDKTGYSLSVTPPTAAQVRTEMDANSTKLANLDAAISSRSSHSAADVWAVATRSLTTFGTLVADIAAAVWGATTRTLSAFGFTVATNSDSNVTAIKAKTDNLPASPAAVGDIPTAAAVADQVWDEILTGASHNISSSAGRRLRQIKESMAEGTATGGGANTITLAVGSSSLDNYYRPALIVINAGTGAGQSRRIDSYEGSTRAATVSTPWVTQPDGTSEYTIYPWASVRVSEIDADVAGADVWASAARTLTAFGFTPTPSNAADVTAIKDKTDLLPASPAAVGSAMTLTGDYDAAKVAASQASVDLSKAILDKLETTVELDGAVYRFTVNSLENSPVGTGGFTSNDRNVIEASQALIKAILGSI